jgi:NifU-like protein involved in Fe-S cluster formation
MVKLLMLSLKTFGCGAAIAHPVWLQRWLKETIEEALKITNKTVAWIA